MDCDVEMNDESTPLMEIVQYSRWIEDTRADALRDARAVCRELTMLMRKYIEDEEIYHAAQRLQELRAKRSEAKKTKHAA
jgi:hypothetical protein